MATIEASAAGGKWAAAAAWTGGVEPTEADDVVLGSGSGSITLDSVAKFRSFDATSYKKTLTISSNSNIGTGTANGTLAVKFGTEMTLVVSGSPAFIFKSTAGSVLKVTLAGQSLGALKFECRSGQKLELMDAVKTTGRIFSESGNIKFTANSECKELDTRGAGTVEVPGGVTLKVGNFEGEASPVVRAESTIKGSGTIEIVGGTGNLQTIREAENAEIEPSLKITADTVRFETGFILSNLELNNGSGQIEVTEGKTLTLTGTLTAAAGTKSKIVSTVTGKSFKLKKTTGTVELTGVALRDCTAEGGATWIDRGVGGLDKGHNAGWLFDENYLIAGHMRFDGANRL